MDFDSCLNEFNKYVANYDLKIVENKYKYDHTLRVIEFTKTICKNENFNEEETNIALICSLLHDIARFYEYMMFKDFKNSNGFDHGKYGVKVLNTHNQYEKFDIHKEDLENIYSAIYYHNKFKLPKKYKDNVFCKIIRDADKIDIMNVMKNRLVTKDEDEINPKLVKAFYNHKLLSWKYKTNSSNSLIFYLGFIYDLNYDYSCKFLLESGYLDNLYNSLNNKERYKVYFDYAKKYLEKRAKNVRYEI